MEKIMPEVINSALSTNTTHPFQQTPSEDSISQHRKTLRNQVALAGLKTFGAATATAYGAVGLAQLSSMQNIASVAGALGINAPSTGWFMPAVTLGSGLYSTLQYGEKALNAFKEYRRSTPAQDLEATQNPSAPPV